MIEWAWDEFLRHMPPGQLFAIMVGMLVGLAATEAIAHMLPRKMDAGDADRIMRLLVLGIAMCCAFALQPTVLGFVMALFDGLAAPTVYQFATRWLYSKFPVLQPKALQE